MGYGFVVLLITLSLLWKIENAYIPSENTEEHNQDKRPTRTSQGTSREQGLSTNNPTRSLNKHTIATKVSSSKEFYIKVNKSPVNISKNNSANKFLKDVKNDTSLGSTKKIRDAVRKSFRNANQNTVVKDTRSKNNFLRIFEKNTINYRVINGETVNDNEYSYVIVLGSVPEKSIHIYRICTGTLIAKNWVLTAAHCVNRRSYDVKKLNMRIYYGDLTAIPNTTEHRRVLATIPHPNYITWSCTNDIGLVMVETTPINTYAKISPVDYLSLVGAAVKYVGGGITVNDSIATREAIGIMRKDQFRPLQIGYAMVAHCRRHDDPPKLICLRAKCSNQKQQINSGDSGGPLFYRNKIVGVACCKSSLPDEKYMSWYTSVSPFIDWIHDTIRKEKVP